MAAKKKAKVKDKTMIETITEKVEEMEDVAEFTIGDGAKKVTDKIPAKKKARSVWKPANIIEIPERFKDPNFRYRCVNFKHEGRVMQKENEHWEVDKYIVPKMRAEGYFGVSQSSLQDGRPMDDTLRFRELIVMRIPKEIAEERKAYYAGLDAMKNQLGNEDDDLHAKTGGRSYGDIKVKRGE